MKTQIEQYIDLFNKGMQNWTKEDNNEAQKIYYALSSFWGHKKAQDMLKRARLEAINKRNATLLKGEK